MSPVIDRESYKVVPLQSAINVHNDPVVACRVMSNVCDVVHSSEVATAFHGMQLQLLRGRSQQRAVVARFSDRVYQQRPQNLEHRAPR